MDQKVRRKLLRCQIIYTASPIGDIPQNNAAALCEALKDV